MAQSWTPTLRRRLMLRTIDALASLGQRGRVIRAIPNDEIERILVVEPKHIGDVVLLLPFLSQLRRIFPNATTTLLAAPHARIILAETKLVDDVIVTHLDWTEESTRYNPLAYNWKELRRLRRDLRERQFDLAFKCCMHIREHLVMELSGARRRIGYAFGIGDKALTDALPVTDPNRHKADDWLTLLERFSPVDRDVAVRLELSDSERRWADSFLLEHGVLPGTTIVGVHPGASVPAKRWPLSRFDEISRALSERADVRVIVFVDPQGYGETMAREGIVSAKVGLRQLMALIERCTLLVCNDSGPMHLAGALGVPTVAIFGSGINQWFAPLGAGHRLITAEAKEDSLHPYDVAAIPVARVLQEIELALEALGKDSSVTPRSLAANQ